MALNLKWPKLNNLLIRTIKGEVKVAYTKRELKLATINTRCKCNFKLSQK